MIFYLKIDRSSFATFRLNWCFFIIFCKMTLNGAWGLKIIHVMMREGSDVAKNVIFKCEICFFLKFPIQVKRSYQHKMMMILFFQTHFHGFSWKSYVECSHLYIKGGCIFFSYFSSSMKISRRILKNDSNPKGEMKICVEFES